MKVRLAPAATDPEPGPPPAMPPDDPPVPVTRTRPVFLALSAAVRAARAAVPVTTSNEWPLAGGARAGLTELDAVSWYPRPGRLIEQPLNVTCPAATVAVRSPGFVQCRTP